MFTIFFGKKEVQNMDDGKLLDTEMFKNFFKKMHSEGVFPPPSQYEAWFVSMAHNEEHLKKTRDCIIAFLEESY